MNTNYKIVSIYIPKKHYALENSKSFLKTNGYKINKVDDLEGYYKFQQLTSKTLRKYGYNDYKYLAKNNDRFGKSIFFRAKPLTFLHRYRSRRCF